MLELTNTRINYWLGQLHCDSTNQTFLGLPTVYWTWDDTSCHIFVIYTSLFTKMVVSKEEKKEIHTYKNIQ